jgi:hypothetical protein
MGLQTKTCHKITPNEQFITVLFAVSLICSGLVLYEIFTLVYNYSLKGNASARLRSSFGSDVTNFFARILYVIVNVILFIMLMILNSGDREDVALTGDGKFVLLPDNKDYSSTTSLEVHCTSYDNVSSDTNGFLTSSIVQSAVTVIFGIFILCSTPTTNLSYV